MPSAGDVLNDRYRLDDRIAAGGMGEVWRATDTLLGRPVAVKVLHDGRAGEREFQTRFHHEARAMAALRHPGIAAVYDYGQTGDGDSAFIVMAYIDGEPLDRRIAEAGRLDPAAAMAIVARAARALDAAHAAGIVHRDVKPGNLIVQPDGSVVLVDFGVARSAALASVTATNDVVGTALYIAPEQVSKRPTGPATDVYALGAVAYHCVAGRPPFVGDNPIAVAVHHLNDEPPPLPADVPEPVRRLIAKAMDKDPSRRYPTAAALAAAADAAPAADAALPADAPPLAATAILRRPDVAPQRPPRRSAAGWWLALLAAMVLALLVALALLWPQGGNPGPSTTPSAGVPGPSAGVGTAPAGGGNGGGGSGRPVASNGTGGSAPATAGTGGNGGPASGGATPTGGGGATGGPQPTATPRQETTGAAPAATTAGVAGGGTSAPAG